ncbi:porin family protein [uncultured Rikenella sp.]|uniref:porin family protein n=1 Tax=uncultured Rikenella sp. TaxID=368003 RepID=UPI00260DFE7B|nr:porin family protein [uncultured Rikenella sp.]
MKKYAILSMAAAAAMIASVSTASAQKTFTWGPKAGMTVSNMSHTDMNAKVGFTAGIFTEYRVDWFGLSGEVLYSRQGVTNKETIDGTKIKTRLKSDYLNVPVLANFYVTQNLALKTGVQAGFCLGASSITKIDGTKTKDGVKNAFHTAEVAIPVGISYDFGPIVLDARYNFGVSHALKAGNSRNNVFQLTAGVRF